MLQSANLIQILKSENKQLKAIIEEMPDSVSEQKNVSDDGKEKHMILKLKNKVQNLNEALQKSDEMITAREKEVVFVLLYNFKLELSLYKNKPYYSVKWLKQNAYIYKIIKKVVHN